MDDSDVLISLRAESLFPPAFPLCIHKYTSMRSAFVTKLHCTGMAHVNLCWPLAWVCITYKEAICVAYITLWWHMILCVLQVHLWLVPTSHPMHLAPANMAALTTLKAIITSRRQPDSNYLVASPPPTCR